jgi:hypothetical protein
MTRASIRQAFALDIVSNNEPGLFSKASSELAAMRLFQTLQNFHVHAPAHDLNTDPMNFIRTTNAVCRLSSSVLKHKTSKPLTAGESRAVPTDPPLQKSEPNRTDPR